MKTKQINIILLLLTAVFLAASPAILRAIPDRYAVRYVPEFLHPIALPQTDIVILPTLAPAADISLLLQPTSVPELPPTFTPPAEPATPTSIPAIDEPTAVPTDPPTATPEPTATATPIPIPPAARLTQIAHQFQDWNNCGPATLAMTLSYFQNHTTQSDTASVLKPNAEDRNVSPDEMVAYVNDRTPQQALFRANGTQDTLRRLVSNGIPVIVEIGIEPPGEFRWLGWYGHYLLIVAYDDTQQQYWVYDSWFGTSEEPLTNADKDGRILTYDTVDIYWPHFNRNYITVYSPEQAPLVANIIGNDIDDATMWQNSLRQAQAEAATNPENGFLWFNLGTSYNAIGDYEKAAAAYDQALATELPWRMLWYQFGPYQAYYQVGRYDDIILLADTTLKDRPYFEESFYYKGLAQAALGDNNGARQNLTAAIDFNPNYTPAIIALNNLDG